MNKQYLHPFDVKSISTFSEEYSIDHEIGVGGQATVWSVSNKNKQSSSSSPKCAKFFKIDTTDLNKSMKEFWKIINLYYIISNNKLSDYYGIYGNCDISSHKWTGIIILMKQYHHTLCDKKYWLKTHQITQISQSSQTTNGNTKCGETEGENNENGDIFEEYLNAGYMIADDWRFLKKIITDLFNHLQKMHMKNVIHNDIKAENVVFDIDDNVWKFIDFDLSMFTQRNGQEGFIVQPKYIGSPYYSAPEIKFDSKFSKSPCIYSKYSDLWSLGMVISWIILRRNHIWFFINFTLKDGYKKINKKEKYAEYYFEICAKSIEINGNNLILECIKTYGMNMKMNMSIYKLLTNMLLFNFKARKSIKYLLGIEIEANSI